MALIALTVTLVSGQGRQPIELRARAPELSGGPWIHTPNGQPITWESRRGKVTVLHYWTFG